MINSIFIAMSGLTAFQDGLRTIANNTANLNTTGFKGSSTRFADAFNTGSGSGSSRNQGFGVKVGSTSLNFTQGPEQQTGNPLDLEINGQGLFTLRDASGNLTYTRDGNFAFKNGILVDRSGNQVMGLDASGGMAPISLAGFNTLAGSATTTLAFTGNVLSSTPTGQSVTLSGVTVIDAAGGVHTLTVQLQILSAQSGTWQVNLMDGTTLVGTGTPLTFDSATGRPTQATAKVSLTYTPTGQTPVPLTLDFGTGVTSNSDGTASAISFNSSGSNGAKQSQLTGETFDATGTLILTYANQQTVKGPRLRLGRFDDADAIGSVGNNQFEVLNAKAWHFGSAAELLTAVTAGSLEGSNVDLSREFSELVVMQRGYQASSQIVSTANEMLQELFSMKGQ